jgi:pyruvate dehydrogenase phosphatase
MLRLIGKRAIHKITGNPSLSIDEINKILRKKESFQTVSTLKSIKRIDSCSVECNDPFEDCSFAKVVKGNAFLGVTDGHWAPDTSKLVSYALPYYMDKFQLPIQKENFISCYEMLDKDILSLPWKALKQMGGSLNDLKKVSNEEKLRCLVESMPAFSGACAISAHISSNELFVAHAGDCRAVLGVYDKDKNTIKARALTEDHQPSNLRELSRLHNDHPDEEKTVVDNPGRGPLRVLGGLMPSRAFGDSRYKYSLDDQAKIDVLLEQGKILSYSWCKPDNLFTPPYMTASPEVFQKVIGANDKFLVLATDGLYDSLSSGDVADHVSDFLKGDTIDINAATHLIRKALEEGKGQQHLSRLLSLSPKVARNYRDDITVQIVFFESTELKDVEGLVELDTI